MADAPNIAELERQLNAGRLARQTAEAAQATAEADRDAAVAAATVGTSGGQMASIINMMAKMTKMLPGWWR